MSAGPIALVGSGEYLPAMLDVEAGLLAGRPPRYVQIPTAAAPEGPGVTRRWVKLGIEQAGRLGVTAVPLLVETREQAEDPAIAEQVRGAGLIYLSGGDPPFLADTLRDTLLWRAIHAQWQAGAALAGCSAGAIALTDWVPDIRRRDAPGRRGLAVVAHLRVLPHFDRLVRWMPDLPERYLLDLPPGAQVVGIDEDTALVGGPADWTVQGRQSAWLITAAGRREFAAGAAITTPV
ncbi:MAG: Type 1 glutamine amidotransferase-like domain-containing protein [Actinomycetota bacterium]|nr:Type 1 glutamine amidotransferase-like domain-containing protein [Actinomycetota bacterium]